ncbi:RagB/SusD family nutrient uptake outer membrane protein [Phocaeicola vulgatus]|uniref:RagB/SusD family nutrient uptake outer membrane protein n=1 Tax=Phocaeicola vulgatus TaxID=821 RepID=UPI000C2275BB|nr:RagB/SusD family nutrient uptake outer membrane protein [Phocaeicola vulgatus]GFH99116.1 SusD-like protein [Bacteroidaceae bacterium]
MRKIYTLVAACLMGLTLTNCDDFLDYNPTAVVDEDKAFEEPDKMVNAAYAMLGDCWYAYPFNLFPYGDITSDDCLKGGSGTTDTGYHPLEIWSTLTATTPGEMDELWYRLYCAVSRCNRALVALDRNGERILGTRLKECRVAEVKFLRAHFYYKLVTLFRQVPWIDEVAYANNTIEQIRNDEFSYKELFGKVIADFEEAYNMLPEKQTDGGRANKVAAAAYLAKCYLNLAWGDGYEATTGESHINAEYMRRVVEYTDVVLSSDYGYLEDYGDIFLPEYKNSKESVFAVQCSDYQDDNTTFGRANWSNMLNGCWGMWSCGWDFHKPSQNLVNAFKTKNGLPMFDDYNEEIAYPVNGQMNGQKWDPRLFHTVGMPTYPYKYEAEYMMTKNNSRTPNTYGYYTSLKEVPQRSKGETYNGSWQAFAMNDYVFRYTDVMLMRAEALVELDKLSEARTIINDIRQRAANSIDKHIAYAKNQCEIALYPETYFQNKGMARQCLRWERRLEMAMENGRYFDLRRWGVASKTLNAYFVTEQHSIYDGQTYAQYYKDARYEAGKNEFFPIPYNQLYYIPGLYTQNKGY